MNAPSTSSSTPAGNHWSESRTLLAAVLAVLMIITGVQWWQIEYSTSRVRAETLSQARLRAAEVAAASSEVIALLFHAVDTTALELVDAYGEVGLRGFRARVRQAVGRLPADAVLQVAVISADGYLAYSSLGMSERTYLGDREHFKVHLEGGTEQFFISRPVLGRVSKQWSIQFSRPIRRAGRLEGVVVLSISPRYLQGAISRLALESGDSLAILRSSGEVLARNRDQDATLGKVKDAHAPFLQPNPPASGTFVGRSELDGVERIFQWRRLEAYPITVVLGLSTAAALGPLERMIDETRFRAILSTAVLWGAVGAVAWLVRRVNRHNRERRELEFVAMHDSLTGLHSRHALMTHLAAVLEEAAAQGGQVGVLYLDLDGFKPVNDQHGHGVGDQVLRAVAGRLKGCVRRGDFPARIGGDEFVVVIDRMADPGALQALRDRIEHALRTPLAVNGLSIPMAASIGLACYPGDGATPDALLGAADRMMYDRKRLQRA